MAAIQVNKICALHHQHQDAHAREDQKNGGCSSSSVKPWYCDRVRVTSFSYNWKIENFFSFNGEAISSVFTSLECQKNKWQLAISKIEKIVILKLKLVCSDQSRIKFKFKGSILNGDNQIAHTIGRDSFYTASPKDVFIFPRPIEIDDLQKSPGGWLAKGALSLICDINVVTDIIDICLFEDFFNTPPDNESQRLYSDMKNLLESGKFSDVTLIVGGQELKAHKNILSLRSDVFAAMFEHELLEENTSNCVFINDFEFGVVREMLTFIYSNRAPQIDDMSEELLAAADKYSLPRLKLMCEALLDRDLSISTALSTLILADRHNSDLLRRRTMHYIKTNLGEIMETVEWQTMISSYPLMIDEIEKYNGCI